MLYLIHAYEGIYNGEDGYDDWDCGYYETYKDVICRAKEMSRYIMDVTYSSEHENFKKEALSKGIEIGSEKYYEFIERMVEDNIRYNIYPLDREKVIENREDFIAKYAMTY